MWSQLLSPHIFPKSEGRYTYKITEARLAPDYYFSIVYKSTSHSSPIIFYLDFIYECSLAIVEITLYSTLIYQHHVFQDGIRKFGQVWPEDQ
jgi:hypothetical protein